MRFKSKILVITRSIKECEELHKSFQLSTIYHHKLTREERSKNSNTFKLSSNLMFSTSGFGTGINIPNIRFVLHFGHPYSLIQYTQESGRAGRDGLESSWILFFLKSSQVVVDETLKSCINLETCRRVYLTKEINGMDSFPCYSLKNIF